MDGKSRWEEHSANSFQPLSVSTTVGGEARYANSRPIQTALLFTDDIGWRPYFGLFTVRCKHVAYKFIS